MRSRWTRIRACSSSSCADSTASSPWCAGAASTSPSASGSAADEACGDRYGGNTSVRDLERSRRGVSIERDRARRPGGGWRGPPPSKAECDGRPDAWGEASRVLRWSFVPSDSPVASGRDGRGVGGEGRRALPHRHALDQPSINAVPSRHRMQHGCRGKPCGTSCESRVEWSAW